MKRYALKELTNKESNFTRNIIEWLSDNIREEERLTFEEIEQMIYEDEIIYYHDAINWLTEYFVTNFKDAIENGCTDLVSIANYYRTDMLITEWNALIGDLE